LAKEDDKVLEGMQKLIEQKMVEEDAEEFIKFIPPDKLNKEEKALIEKIKKGKIDPKDPKTVKKVKNLLKKFSKEISKGLEVSEAKEEIEKDLEESKKFVKLIRDERELFKLFPSENIIKVPVPGKDDVLVEFKVKPIEKGDDLSILNIDTQVLEDLPDPDKLILAKERSGAKLTKEERDRLEEIQLLLFEKSNANIPEMMDAMNEFLAKFITPPDCNGDIKERKRFWQHTPFKFRVDVMTEALEVLGLGPETSERLF